jgi:TolB protein
VKFSIQKKTEDSVDNILPVWSPAGDALCYIRLIDPDPFLEQFDSGSVGILSGDEIRDTEVPCLLNYRERGRGGMELRPVWQRDSILCHRPTEGTRWSLFRIERTSGRGCAVSDERYDEDLYKSLWPSPKGDLVLTLVQRGIRDDLRLIRSDPPDATAGDPALLSHPSLPLEGWDVVRTRWSPDGKKVGFLLQRREPHRDAEREMRRLGVLDLITGKFDCLEETWGLGMLSWSPAGEAVTFHQMDRKGVSEIRVMDLAQRNTTVLARGPEGGTDPLWSPGGDWILFQIRTGEGRTLGIARPEGSEEVRLTRGGWCIYPSWSPGGERMMFMRTTPTLGPFYGWKTRLCMIDLRLRREWKVGSEEFRCFVDTCCPVWSPDGERIAFSARDEIMRNGKLSIWMAEISKTSG